MTVETPSAAEAAGAEAAEENRRRLRDAGVFCVSLVGGPGCGKTALLEKTIERLSPEAEAAAASITPSAG